MIRFIIATLYFFISFSASAAEREIRVNPISESQCQSLAQELKAEKNISGIKISTGKFDAQLPNPHSSLSDAVSDDKKLPIQSTYDWKLMYRHVGNSCHIDFLGQVNGEDLMSDLGFDTSNSLRPTGACGYGGDEIYANQNAICTVVWDEKCVECESCGHGEGCGEDECKKTKYYGYLNCIQKPKTSAYK